MLQHELKPTEGSKRNKIRRGRGDGSGKGTYSGRGCKGQNSRSGGGVRPGFEGGQTPLYKRLPKLKGFKNLFKTEYQTVNVSDLNKCTGKEITAAELFAAGLIRKVDVPVKILGDGNIDMKITVKVDKISASAQEKIEKAGGKVELIVIEKKEHSQRKVPIEKK